MNCPDLVLTGCSLANFKSRREKIRGGSCCLPMNPAMQVTKQVLHSATLENSHPSTSLPISPLRLPRIGDDINYEEDTVGSVLCQAITLILL